MKRSGPMRERPIGGSRWTPQGAPLRSKVGASVPATALALDLRGFTAVMSATEGDPAGRHELCALLTEMNGIAVRCAELAVEPGLRERVTEVVHLASTGDGAIVVFLDPEAHPRHGMLALLLMRVQMHRALQRFREQTGRHLAFGLGVESGEVRAVGAAARLQLGTYIGDCINAAARVEVLTKDIHRTEAIVCANTVERLCEELYEVDYRALMASTAIPAGSITDQEYLALERRMVEVNRRLCLNYLHLHRLRGFAEPLALFRVSRSSAAVGNPRFDAFLRRLVREDPTWLAEVRSQL